MDVSEKVLRDTVCLYRKAVDFYIHVMLEQWEQDLETPVYKATRAGVRIFHLW